MDKKRFLLASAAYVVMVMVIATAWHIGLFKDVYADARIREQPLFHLGIASIVIRALVVAYVYPLCSLSGSPVARGLKFGLLTGLLLGSYGVLAEAGKYDVGPVPTFLFYEGAFFAIQYSLVGIAVGLIYGQTQLR